MYNRDNYRIDRVTKKITPFPVVSVRVRVCLPFYKKKVKKSHSYRAYTTRAARPEFRSRARLYSRRLHARTYARASAHARAARARPDRPGDFAELKLLLGGPRGIYYYNYVYRFR